MCFGGGGNQRPQVAKYKSKNDPVVITGEQEGLEKKKKKTETADSLKILLLLYRRQTYFQQVLHTYLLRLCLVPSIPY